MLCILLDNSKNLCNEVSQIYHNVRKVLETIEPLYVAV
jgi:hypothetical protein